MKKYLLTVLFLWMACTYLQAQETDFAPAFEVKVDTAAFINIPYENWQYIEEDEPVSFKTVSSAAYSKNFRQGKEVKEYISSYWMRYNIKNSLKIPLRFTIHTFKEGHVYFVRNNKIEHYLSGYYVPKSKRDGLDKVLGIEYSLPVGESVTVYLHDPRYDYEGLSPYIGIWDKVVQAYYIDYEEPSDNNRVFLGGFIFLAGLFNLLFYYIIKERVYLFYALALIVIAMGCAQTVFFGLLIDEAPQAGNILMYVIYMAGMLLVLMVMAMFLRVDYYYPRLYRVFMAISILGAVMGFMAYTKDMFNFWDNITLAANLTCAVPAGFLIITAVVQVFKKRKQAYLFSVAVFPLTVCMFIALVVSVETPEWFTYLEQASAAWGIAVISWSLFQRFRKIMNDNVQQALDNERLAREKEEERNALIAAQNETLEHQVAERTAEVQQSLAELRQTQNQLIQSEKMASLGELTAGIAHEIQNPLNFVNNFSDVSIELLEEMGEELDKGDTDEAKSIASDIKDNLTKIAHHGRRADSIVKGMLQHSRASSGQKELTDINALADEYLRLSYHGLRAKDKTFNADLITHFAEGLPKINLVPQDMGRVFLNLFTNAFYATQERSRQAAGSFKPVVEISTQLKGNSVEIVVKDNGTGIPEAIKDKIVQPFFTTKPTGEGTGLGLSLSYDIVVKAHSGTIDIESAEGQGAAFIITLPI